jgi:hypothetical protein
MSNFCDLVNFSITIQPRLTILNPNDLDLIFMVTIFGCHIDDRGCILIFMSPWPNFSFVDLILFSEKHLTQMFQVTDMTQISLHLIVLASDINSLKLTKSQKFDIATLLLPEKQYLCLAFSNIFVPNETKKSQVHTGNAKKALKYSTNKSSVIRNSSWKYKIYIHIITK